MSVILNKYYKNLELDKILSLLAEKTSCETSRILAKSIIPSSNLDTVKLLLAETSDAHMLIARFNVPSFCGLCDITLATKKAVSGATLSIVELLKISRNLHVFNSLEKFKEQVSTIKTALDSRFEQVVPNKYLENRINSCIISEDEISDTASPELSSIRKKIRKTSEAIRSQLDKMLRSPNIQKFLQENIVTIKSERFVLPVRAEFRKEISGLVHETSSSGATVFIEPTGVVDANNEIKILRQNEKKEIEKILRELSSEVATFSENILNSYQICVELDVIFAKAELAYSMNAALPKVNDNGKISLKNARHPLIDKKNVVPTSISLGQNFSTLVITGPNTGGKTVLLKTVGLFAAMTMCGLMIPVSEFSEISVFDHILSDIGDEQSIEQSLSTFSSHMVNIIKILSVVNKNSLVLLDELGAGTDPIEGAALAIAILETLKKTGCKILATTHYAELKAYALATFNVENACCEFDVHSLKPTYNLLVGMPGNSNAFAISRRLGLQQHIIDVAQNFISDENLKFENVVKNLENIRQNLEKEKRDIEKIKEKLTSELNFVQKEKNFVKNWRDTELKKAKIKSENIVSTAKAMADDLIDEIKKIKKSGLNNNNFVGILKSNIDKINAAIDPVEQRKNENYTLPRKLKVGDNVLIFDIDKKGTILDIGANGTVITVQAGLIKTRVPIENIRLLDKNINNKKKIPSISTRNLRNKSKPLTRELDVRGKTALEATLELDSFIDNAVLANIGILTIIHGKGTGVLRTEIAKYLKKHPNVKTFRLGTFGEGESGVTIVELK